MGHVKRKNGCQRQRHVRYSPEVERREKLPEIQSTVSQIPECNFLELPSSPCKSGNHEKLHASATCFQDLTPNMLHEKQTVTWLGRHIGTEWGDFTGTSFQHRARGKAGPGTG